MWKRMQFQLPWLGIFFLVAFNLVIQLKMAVSPAINIRGVEMNVAYTVQKVMSGSEVYLNPEAPPYAITQYTPLYYIVVSSFSEILHLVPGIEVSRIYKVGRLVSVSFGILSAVVLATWSKRHTQNWLWSSLLGLLALTLPLPWFLLFRIDSIAAFFGIASLYVYSSSFFHQKWKEDILVLSGYSSFLAFLSKQNFIIFFALIIIYALMKRSYRDLYYVALGFFAMFVVTSIMYTDLYSFFPVDNNYIYHNIIDGVKNGINLDLAYSKLFRVLFTDYQIIFILSVFFSASFFIHRKKKVDEKFIWYSFLLLLLFNLTIGLKNGSAINYMSEVLLIGTLGLSLKGKQLGVITHYFSEFRGLIFVITLMYVLFLITDSYLKYQKVFEQRYEDVYNIELVEMLQQYLDDASYFYSSSREVNNRFFQRALFPQSEIAVVNARQKVFKYDLSSLIQSGQFQYIVSQSDRVENVAHLPGYTIDPAKIELLDYIEGYYLYRIQR